MSRGQPEEILSKAREKALESPTIGKHGKTKLTLLREEAEDKFVEEIKDSYLEVFKVHKGEAKKPRNYQERRDFIDRIIRKLERDESKTEQHLHQHLHLELTPERQKLIEEYEQKLKEIKTKN